jgi:GNAT superfamily N-acetyltransferase
VSLQIRNAELSDLPAIDQLDPFAGDRRAEIVAGVCLVAETEGTLAGYLTFSRNGFLEQPFVHYLAVQKAYRRRGVAIALIRAAEREVGAKRLFSSTEEDNAEMLALFQNDGWTRAGFIAGANVDGKAEVFFYRDLTGAE